MRRLSIDNWFSTEQLISLLEYDDYNVKTFILYYLSLLDCEEYNLHGLIANELINSKLETEKIFTFLNILLEDINQESIVVNKNRAIATLMHICGEMLECCLNSLQQNKNIEKTEEILENLLSFKFLNDNLSAKGANALAAIRKLNIQALNAKIDRLLKTRCKDTLTHKLNINKPYKHLTFLEDTVGLFRDAIYNPRYTSDYNNNISEDHYSNDGSEKAIKQRSEYAEEINKHKKDAADFLKILKQQTSNHLEEKTKKLTGFKSIQNWTPSNKIHLINLIHGNAPFEHDQKDIKQTESVFISNLPIIISKYTMNIYRHKATGKFINFYKLLSSDENPISRESVKLFLKKHNIPIRNINNIKEDSDECKDIERKLNHSTPTNCSYSFKCFDKLSPEDISKTIYSKMLATFGSLTFYISASDKSYNGFTTVTTEEELQDVIDNHLTVENIHRVDFNGLQNVDFSEDADEYLLKMFEKTHGTKHAFFTTNDMHKVASEMLNPAISNNNLNTPENL